ncbi:peptidoglycan recognition protein 2 precursor-like protein, partial [Leptotrombidium deliense]
MNGSLGIHDHKSACNGINFISRKEWNASEPKEPSVYINPVPHVFIHHSAGDFECSSFLQCSESVRRIQRFHQDDRGWDDIGYNWLIGGDGNVYEGRNWDKEGAHTLSFNKNG